MLGCRCLSVFSSKPFWVYGASEMQPSFSACHLYKGCNRQMPIRRRKVSCCSFKGNQCVLLILCSRYCYSGRSIIFCTEYSFYVGFDELCVIFLISISFRLIFYSISFMTILLFRLLGLILTYLYFVLLINQTFIYIMISVN